MSILDVLTLSLGLVAAFFLTLTVVNLIRTEIQWHEIERIRKERRRISGGVPR